MANWLKNLFIGIAKLLAVIVFIFAGYLAWLGLEGSQVRSFCSAVRPGAPVSSLQQIASSHGINQRYLRGTEEKEFLFVPVAATIGEEGCAIKHDGKVVLSAHM